MQFADVKTDISFKKTFGCEEHKEVLIGFLNAVLDFQVVSYADIHGRAGYEIHS